MDVQATLRKLRSEKRWFDEMIAALEEFKRSKPFQAAHLLGLHLARHGRLDRRTISPQSRRRLSRWLGTPPHRPRPRPAA